jgi:hypothetical protein
MTPNTIEFRITHNEAPKWVMKITADRRIEVNEEVEVTEAAKKVLEAMQWMLDKQKRQWVGLTDAEIVDIMDVELTTQNTEHFAFCQAIEAKLKEKNRGLA